MAWSNTVSSAGNRAWSNSTVATPGSVAVGAESVGGIVIGTLWAGVVAPFQAHVLTSIYYRLTDESRPVVHPSLLR